MEGSKRRNAELVSANIWFCFMVGISFFLFSRCLVGSGGLGVSLEKVKTTEKKSSSRKTHMEN